MAAVAAVKYWVSTVSREHVMIGVKEGFCQVCHGKKPPLARMKKNDWIIYYSPKLSMSGKAICQKFTAIGKIADDRIFQFKMSDNFVPFRRNVSYLKDIQETPIHPLLEKLSFTQGKKNWGFPFRLGIFEITQADFDLIHQQMTTKSSKKRKAKDGDSLPYSIEEKNDLDDSTAVKRAQKKRYLSPSEDMDEKKA